MDQSTSVESLTNADARPTPGHKRGGRARWSRAGLALAAGGVAGLGLGGCEIDNFINPSEVGRWEMTPTVVPILDRIAAIEGPEEIWVEYSDVQPEDLVPEVSEYKVGPGDVLSLTIWNLEMGGQASLLERRVDSRGYVDIPQVGSVYVDGQTMEGVRGSIKEAVRPLTGDTTVDVLVLQEQQRTFNILGSAVAGQGPYFVPYADYRLIDALAAAGGVAEDIAYIEHYIYIIRQVPLTDEATGRNRPLPPTGATPPASPDGQPPANGDNLLDVIDDLLEPGAAPQGGSTPPGGMGSPAAFAGASDRGDTRPLPVALIETLPAQPGQPSSTPVPPAPTSTGQWLYLNGEWVMVARRVGTGPSDDSARLFTQRVIRVPVKPLMEGDARYNLVIRPNDIIRVPRPAQGTIFLAGQVARPGSYGLAPRLTLTRALFAGGGMGQLAVPERTDLIRMVGPNQQATIRLNLRAIFDGSQPDVFMKDNDIVNVGTNFWAYPLAVLRGGLRASYGYGFILDRNFGNDVFGVPPGSVNN